MAQPEFVPGPSPADTPRGRLVPGEVLPGHPGWKADRPGDHVPGERPPSGAAFGKPGPDQGYALLLAKRFADRLQLARGESQHDAVAGCLGVALRRASLFHRAPVTPDLELAFGVWGFLTLEAPADLVAFRRSLFEAAAHAYNAQREIAGLVSESALRMKPAEAIDAMRADWRSLLNFPPATSGT